MEIKKEIIRKVINDWDPMNFLIHAPENEYDMEIEKIFNSYIEDFNLLSDRIFKVFVDSFGEDFKKNREDCLVISKTILNIKK